MAGRYLLHLTLQVVGKLQRCILPALHPRQLFLLETKLRLCGGEALAEIAALLLERLFQRIKPLFNPGQIARIHRASAPRQKSEGKPETMPALSANVRKAAAEATLQFDWLLPPDRPMLRIAEIATATGMRSTFLEEWFAEKCHRYGADQRTRPAMRIPRAFAIELLVHSAKYTPQDKLDAVMGLAREFTAEECERIAAHFRETGAKKSFPR